MKNIEESRQNNMEGEKTARDVSLYFLSELSLSYMLLFIFKPVILLKILHLYLILYIQKKKVNITCNSWITSYPYPHYNFYQGFFNKLTNILRFLCHFVVCSGIFWHSQVV